MSKSILTGDSQVVIGNRARGPRVVKDESAVNAARRAGAQIGTEKKCTFFLFSLSLSLSFVPGFFITHI